MQVNCAKLNRFDVCFRGTARVAPVFLNVEVKLHIFRRRTARVSLMGLMTFDLLLLRKSAGRPLLLNF